MRTFALQEAGKPLPENRSGPVPQPRLVSAVCWQTNVEKVTRSRKNISSVKDLLQRANKRRCTNPKTRALAFSFHSWADPELT